MQFEFRCPTNFSLSRELDKLKLVEHQTASLPRKRKAVSAASSARSARQHEAWGVSRVSGPKDSGSPWSGRQIWKQRSLPLARELNISYTVVPGAYAPVFMLSTASQVRDGQN